MGLTFPCELISWNVLPAVRREIAQYLITEKQISRKIVAKKLSLTEAAICQYLKGKRGSNHKFNDSDRKKLKKMADLMMESDKGFDGMCVVCKEFDAAKDIMKSAGMKNPIF